MNQHSVFGRKSSVYQTGRSKPSPRLQRVLSILCLAFLVTVLPVLAHPPSDIVLDYDADSQTLRVTLSHRVSDPATHYVNLIHVSLNGTVATYEYESQPTDSQFTYEFLLPARPGDTVEVTADCNLGGSISGSLIIGGPLTVTAVPEFWPFHAALMVSGLVLALVAANSAMNKTPKTSWLRVHKAVGALGVILVVVGLLLASYMVSARGGPHFRVYHAYLGIVTLLLAILTPVVGMVSLKRRPPSPGIRGMHIWFSRVTLVLLIVTAASGILSAGLI